MASSKQPARRSVLIVARLITAVVSLAGAEGVLWLGHYPDWWAMDPNWGSAPPEYKPDPELGWSNREGSLDLLWPGLREGPQRVTNWSRGRRATSAQEPRDSSRQQVLFFGCSYVQGYGLSDAETLPWMVQQRHPELEVSNFGTGNYGTYQSLLSMKRNVHGPVSVYYQFDGFHEDRNIAALSWLRVNKRPPPGWFFPYAVLKNGQIEERRSRGYLVWPISRHLRTGALVQEWIQIIATYPRVREKRAVTEKLLESMDRLVKGRGGRFTVILFDLDPEQRRQYRSFLTSHGIAFVDCDHPELKDRSLRQPDAHPGEKLNRLLSDWIEPIAAVPASVTAQSEVSAPQ